MDEISLIIGQLWALIQSWGDLSLQMKISGVVLTLIAIWKTSLVRPLWDKLGAAKVLVAPILGMVAAIVAIEPLSLSAVLEGLKGGTLAIALHQLLDAIKLLPKLGDTYKSLISFFQSLLGGKKEA